MKQVIASVAGVISAPFLVIGVGLLFVVLMTGRPIPWLDRALDRVVDGPWFKVKPCAS